MNRCTPTNTLVSSPLAAFFNDPFMGLDLPRFANATYRRPNRSLELATDYYENEHNFFLRLELPGVKKEDVKLSVEKDQLTVTWERKSAEDDKEESATWRRVLPVPEGISSGSISAKLEDGILTVTLPKSDEVKPREITVE